MPSRSLPPGRGRVICFGVRAGSSRYAPTTLPPSTRRPGAVWAADFSEPPQPVEGYPRLLAVRDLASGWQLLWLPLPDESARTAADGPGSLFPEHGAPLVVKSDNGSAFLAGDREALLAGCGVWHLFSPPRTPRYNGSCEASIG